MTTAQILARFPKLAVLVVGDICLDRWCTYDPSTAEPSRETGIPRIGVVGAEATPGAGGTVANNLLALGAGRVAVLGVIGDDGFGFELERALQARGADATPLVREPGVQTFTYTKLLNAQTGVEDRPRVDFINTRPMPERAENQVLERLRAAAESFDAVVAADQAETEEGGVVSPKVRTLLAELARRYRDKVFLADSRMRIERFRDVIVKPNREEADAACVKLFGVTDYARLRRELSAPVLIVTRGADGALVVGEKGETLVRTRRVEEPVDICGAGDSFTAGTALALAAGASPEQAARLGNLTASVTIMKKGTGTATPAEVLMRGEAAPE